MSHGISPSSPFGTALKALKTAERAELAAQGAIARAGLARTIVNSAAVVNGNPIFVPAAADFAVAMAAAPRFKISVCGFFRAAAVDTAFVVQIVQDPGGANTLVGPAITVDSSHVNANGAYALPEIIVTPAAGSVLKWVARISSAGTNAQVLAANEASVTVTPLAA